MRINNIPQISLYKNSKNITQSLPAKPMFMANKIKGTQKIAKAFIPTMAATSLYSLSLNEVVDSNGIVEEFYKNENLGKEKIGVSLDKYTEEEKYNILLNAEEIKLRPKVFTKIANLIKDDKTPRFRLSETLDLYLDVSQNIQDYPEVFRMVINARTKDNEFKYDAKDCSNLMQYAELFAKYPKSFRVACNSDEFQAEDCVRLISEYGEYTEQVPQILLQVVEKTKREGNSKKYIQTIVEDIKDIQLNSSKGIMYMPSKRVGEGAQSLFKRAAEASRYDKPLVLSDGHTVSKALVNRIAENNELCPQKCRFVMNITNPDGTPKFTEQEFCELLADANYYKISREPDNFHKLLGALDSNGNPMFDVDECRDLLIHNTRSGRFVAGIACNLKKDDGSLRFSKEDLKIIASETINSKDFSPFEIAAQKKDEQGNYKYGLYACIMACEAPVLYEDVFNELVAQKNKEYGTKFKPETVKELDPKLEFIFQNSGRYGYLCGW